MANVNRWFEMLLFIDLYCYFDIKVDFLDFLGKNANIYLLHV